MSLDSTWDLAKTLHMAIINIYGGLQLLIPRVLVDPAGGMNLVAQCAEDINNLPRIGVNYDS